VDTKTTSGTFAFSFVYENVKIQLLLTQPAQHSAVFGVLTIFALSKHS